MASKIVSDKQKSATAIDSLIDTNIEPVSSAAEQLLSLHAGEKVDLRPLLHGLRGLLSSNAKGMESATQAHEKELSDDPEALQKRDDASEALYSLLTRAREVFTGIYGANALASLGFTGSTPQDPSLLSAFAKSIIQTIKGVTLKPIDDEISYNPAKKIAEIEAATAALDATLTNVSKEKREADQTLSAKNQKIEAYDTAFSRVSNVLVSLFALVGQEELARKAKPSTRRPGQTEENESGQ